MEQARYFVLAKRGREIVEESSWEEKAFAQDAAGMLGGCVWPPRSYTCSFCRREFRSAQALGGHMNVHRRDRAKLKQFSTPTNNQNILNNPRLTDCYLDQNTCSYTPLLTDNKSPRKKTDCCFDFQNSNPDFHPAVVNSVHQEIFVPKPHFLPSFELSPDKNPFSTLTSNDLEKNEKSSLPMILVFADNDQPIEEVEDDDEDAPKRRKRRRYDDEVDEEQILEVHDLKSCAVQELDLELRLGDPPKTC